MFGCVFPFPLERREMWATRKGPYIQSVVWWQFIPHRLGILRHVGGHADHRSLETTSRYGWFSFHLNYFNARRTSVSKRPNLQAVVLSIRSLHRLEHATEVWMSSSSIDNSIRHGMGYRFKPRTARTIVRSGHHCLLRKRLNQLLHEHFCG